MSENLVTMTLEIDQDVYEKATKICKQLGTTIEIMAESFIKFCVVPENLSLLEAFINIEKGAVAKQPHAKQKKRGRKQ